MSQYSLPPVLIHFVCIIYHPVKSFSVFSCEKPEEAPSLQAGFAWTRVWHQVFNFITLLISKTLRSILRNAAMLNSSGSSLRPDLGLDKDEGCEICWMFCHQSRPVLRLLTTLSIVLTVCCFLETFRHDYCITFLLRSKIHCEFSKSVNDIFWSDGEQTVWR